MVIDDARRAALALALALAGGCDRGEAPAAGDPAAASAVAVPEMDPVDLLTRVSLDLRGVRPTPDEIARVEAEPSQVDALAREFMDDPRFEERMVDFWAEVYLTRADAFPFDAGDFGRDDSAAFTRSVGEEPLRLVARVAAGDRPWTDVVTADWTMADAVLADVYPLDRPAGDDAAWLESRYTDGRPAAGVLATNGMWWRYTSTDSNANRKRANQVSRVLLCHDYLVRPIDFERDVDLLDEDAVQDAVSNNPSCVNCHASLDPVASYLFGFWSYNGDSWVDASTYHPERELLWQDYLEVAPGWYGDPGSSLADLGVQIAQDPRFPQCAVEQVYAGLLRREVTLADSDALTGHREAFLEGELRIKALIASVIADPRYRAADAGDPALEAVGAVPRKMVTPDQLADQVEALTGFRWTYGDYEMLSTDLVGLRTLAGGADGQAVTRSATEPNATLLLVQERLAEAAAITALAHDVGATPGERRLFSQVDFTETPGGAGRAAMVAQLQDLHLRLFGDRVAADGEEVAANLALWEELHAIDGDPYLAWVGVLTALLRDPAFLFY